MVDMPSAALQKHAYQLLFVSKFHPRTSICGFESHNGGMVESWIKLKWPSRQVLWNTWFRKHQTALCYILLSSPNMTITAEARESSAYWKINDVFLSSKNICIKQWYQQWYQNVFVLGKKRNPYKTVLYVKLTWILIIYESLRLAELSTVWCLIHSI